jgi:hypothetical protein
MWPHLSVRKGCLLFLVLLLIIGVGTMVWRSCQPDKALEPFAVIKEIARSVCNGSMQKQPISSMPYHVGKILAVRSDGEAIGHIMEFAPIQDVIAVSSQEIGTLICVGDTVLTEIDHSSERAAAYQISRDIYVVDWTTSDVIYKINLKGTLPLTPVSKVDAIAGTDPEYTLLLDFISHLPEK